MARDEIHVLGPLVLTPENVVTHDLVLGDGPAARKVTIELPMDAAGFAAQQNEIVPLWAEDDDRAGKWWAYRGFVLCLRNPELELTLTPGQLTALMKHRVIREEKRWAKIHRELEELDNLERLPSARRERIPDSVRLFVWQRDEGKCVQCASIVNLEFDHIIPVVKGGANTERNIRLLCETCNRRKGAQI
jgi:hypothetical protein